MWLSMKLNANRHIFHFIYLFENFHNTDHDYDMNETESHDGSQNLKKNFILV